MARRVLVGVKRAVDYAVKVRVKSDGSGVDTSSVKHSMNPFCAIALEAAVSLKERGAVDEVVGVSVAPDAKDVLRHALAVGADRVVHVPSPAMVRPRAVARVLACVARQEDAGLVILGKVSIDGEHAQTGGMLAGMLGWPQACYASNIEIDGDEVIVTCEVDDGLETLALRLPAVVTCDLRLNEPRYAKLANVMKAKKKKIETMAVDDVLFETDIETLEVTAPPSRKPGIVVDSVEELVDKLRNEAKVM